MVKSVENRVLFDSSGCITEQAITSLIDNSLSEREFILLKKHADKCDLCADALEGAKHFKSTTSFQAGIKQMHQSRFRKSLSDNTRSRKLLYGISSAAASIILLFGIYFILRLDDIVLEEMPEITNHKHYSVLNDSVKPTPPIVDETRIVTDIALNEPHKTEKKIPKPKKPLMVVDEIVLNEYEEEIIVEEIEFNGIEHDVELELIPVISDEAKIESVAQNEISKEDAKDSEHVGMAQASSEDLTSENREVKKRSLSRKGKSESKTPNEAYYLAEVTPMFQGGSVDKFNRYLADNLKVIIPDTVLIESIVISFVIDTDGNIDKVKLVSGTSSDELNAHIIEFVKSSPVWIPGYSAGKPIETMQESEIVLDSTHRVKVQ